MAGAGLEPQQATMRAKYAGGFLRRWPLLKRTMPCLRDPTLAESTLPTIAEARKLHDLDAMLASEDGEYKPPAQRKLSSVARHSLWLAHADRLMAFDEARDARHAAGERVLRHREAARFISASQNIAGKAWDDDERRTESRVERVALQRKFGLYLSDAADANATLAALGHTPDWLGDGDGGMTGAAKGERNTRHDAVDDVWHALTTASSTKPVKKLTKGNYKNPASVARARMQGDLYNAGKIGDGVEVGGAPGGKIRIRETKCYTPLVLSTAGTGSRGGPAMVGHTHAMGNTEESLRRINLGEDDADADGEAFDHATGIGCVRGVRAKYHDALHVKGNTVDLYISEVFGGLNATGMARLAAGSKAVVANSDIDGTAYNIERRWRLSFYL